MMVPLSSLLAAASFRWSNISCLVCTRFSPIKVIKSNIAEEASQHGPGAISHPLEGRESRSTAIAEIEADAHQLANAEEDREQVRLLDQREPQGAQGAHNQNARSHQVLADKQLLDVQARPVQESQPTDQAHHGQAEASAEFSRC